MVITLTLAEGPKYLRPSHPDAPRMSNEEISAILDKIKLDVDRRSKRLARPMAAPQGTGANRGTSIVEGNKMSGEVARANIVPLPTSVEDMLSQRRTMAGRTLNDYVEDLHIKAWTDPKYQQFLDAVYDEDAIEGSLSADNYSAAQMLRDLARKQAVAQVATRKLATIVKALNVVLRRYRMTRKERAMTIGGQVMANGSEA